MPRGCGEVFRGSSGAMLGPFCRHLVKTKDSIGAKMIPRRNFGVPQDPLETTLSSSWDRFWIQLVPRCSRDVILEFPGLSWDYFVVILRQFLDSIGTKIVPRCHFGILRDPLETTLSSSWYHLWIKLVPRWSRIISESSGTLLRSLCRHL